MPASESNSESPERRLSFWDATGLVVSDMVGSGIFVIPAFVAFNVDSGGWMLAAWICGGLYALLGALTYAELAAAMPEAGGEYVYLREAYGPLVGFLSGWASLFIGFSAPIAIVALVFTEYFSYFWPLLADEGALFSIGSYSITNAQLFTVAALTLLASMHFIGRGTDRRFQLILTIIKFSVIGAVILLAAFSGSGDAARPFSFPETSNVTLGAFIASIVIVTFSYSGWNASSYIAGEVKNPSRNLPLSLLVGTISVMILYLVIIAVYNYALPVSDIAGDTRVAVSAVQALLGSGGAPWISAAIALSALGAANSMLWLGPRVLYAMSKDNAFFAFAGKINPRTQVPDRSLLVMSITAIIMVLLADLHSLLEAAGFVLIVFNFLAVASVFVLRFRRPDLARPYRTLAYPVTPAIFLAFCVYVLYSNIKYNLSEDRLDAILVGIGLVLVGIPAYFVFQSLRRRSTR